MTGASAETGGTVRVSWHLVDSTTVVNNDGQHGATTVTGAIALRVHAEVGSAVLLQDGADGTIFYYWYGFV